MNETEAIDKLFLELSQFTRATTETELKLKAILLGGIRLIEDNLDTSLNSDAEAWLCVAKAWSQ